MVEELAAKCPLKLALVCTGLSFKTRDETFWPLDQGFQNPLGEEDLEGRLYDLRSIP